MSSRYSLSGRSFRRQGVLLALLLLFVLGILVVPGVISHMVQIATVSNWGPTAAMDHTGSVVVVSGYHGPSATISNWSIPDVLNHM